MSDNRIGQQIAEAVDDVVDAIKPKLRGWLHLAMSPLTLAAGIVLIALSPTSAARWSAAVFAVTAVLLFATSATYHRGNWSPKIDALLKRLDHSNIFLIIAGSYTPFALALPPEESRRMLVTVWVGALLGVLFRVFWIGAPRWLYTPVYVLLGWVAVFYLKPLVEGAGWTIVILISVGGLLYSLGALVYGFKRPNPSPRWFGFHEIFHALTIAAFVTHYVAASLVLYRQPA